MRISWIGFLDPFVYDGGGELSQRALVEAGRRRGHSIHLASFLRNRPQRALRRTRLWRSLRVDWDADAFVLSNLRNAPHFPVRIPSETTQRALDSGRAFIHQQAWVDVCSFDLPCGGDTNRCRPDCSRAFANHLYGSAFGAIFNSPMQRRLIGNVIDVPLPLHVIDEGPLVDPDLFQPRSGPRDIDVLYVGTISKAKGYYNLIERFGADRLTFVGPNHLGHRVAGTYLGTASHEALSDIYNRARIFAHLPEWLEPMGRAVVEAALCGCTIVVNDRVGVTSIPEGRWKQRDFVREAPTRFWQQLEASLE